MLDLELAISDADDPAFPKVAESPQTERLVLEAGAYFGRTLAALLGGAWRIDDGRLVLADVGRCGLIVDPFQVARDRVLRGPPYSFVNHLEVYERLAAALGREDSPVTRPSETARPRTFPHFVLWAISLPERIVRSAAGLAGLIGAGAARLLPRPVRETRFYRTLVTRYLRILSDDIGGAGRFPEGQAMDVQTAARLGVGSMLDNLCILTLHASPLWILFAAQDVAKGARTPRLADHGRPQGAGPRRRRARASTTSTCSSRPSRSSPSGPSDVIDMPPLKPDEIKEAIADLKLNIASAPARPLVDVAQLDKFAEDVRKLAAQSSQSVLDVLTGLATQTAAKGGKLVLGTGQALVTSIRLARRAGRRRARRLRQPPPRHDDARVLVLARRLARPPAPRDAEPVRRRARDLDRDRAHVREARARALAAAVGAER